MNGWLIVDGVLFVLLLIALVFRALLADRYQRVSMTLGGSLVAVSVCESLVAGPHLWSVGLGLVALLFFAVEFVRQSRRVDRSKDRSLQEDRR